MYSSCNFKLTRDEKYDSMFNSVKTQFQGLFLYEIRLGHPIRMRGCNSRRKIPGFKGHGVPADFVAVHIGFNNLISEGMLKEDLHVFPEASRDEYADATRVIVLRH